MLKFFSNKKRKRVVLEYGILSRVEVGAKSQFEELDFSKDGCYKKGKWKGTNLIISFKF